MVGGTLRGCRNGVDLELDEAEERATFTDLRVIGNLDKGFSCQAIGPCMVEHSTLRRNTTGARLRVGRVTDSKLAGNRDAGVSASRSVSVERNLIAANYTGVRSLEAQLQARHNRIVGNSATGSASKNPPAPSMPT